MNSTALRAFSVFLAFPFGLYLLLGAYIAVRNVKWPWFMHPMFDVVVFLFSAFGEPVGVYVGAAALALFGFFFALALLFVFTSSLSLRSNGR